MIYEPFTLDRTTHALTFQRRIAATPDWLFRAWTDPAQLRLWWDPTGKPLVRAEVDLRPGGSMTLVTADHAAHPFVGVYTKIDPPHGLEFEAMGAQGTVSLRAQGDVTELLVEIRCASAEHLEQMLKMGVAQGTAVTVNNLAAHAARLLAA